MLVKRNSRDFEKVSLDTISPANSWLFLKSNRANKEFAVNTAFELNEAMNQMFAFIGFGRQVSYLDLGKYIAQIAEGGNQYLAENLFFAAIRKIAKSFVIIVETDYFVVRSRGLNNVVQNVEEVANFLFINAELSLAKQQEQETQDLLNVMQSVKQAVVETKEVSTTEEEKKKKRVRAGLLKQEKQQRKEHLQEQAELKQQTADIETAQNI
jgi:hypothetical protein